MARPDRCGVVLSAGETGSTLFRRILCDAAERWPDVFASGAVPAEGKAFRVGFGEALTSFEAARRSATERLAIGRFIVERAASAFSLADAEGECGLDAALADPGEPAALEMVPLSGKARLTPRIPYRGRVFTGAEIRELGALLVDEARATRPVADALDWLVEQAVDAAGEIDLAGRRFAMFGAGAEIAPTQLLLEAGADVLWVDNAAPPDALLKDSSLSGRLFVPARTSDLLGGPRAMAATLRRFAAEGPVDVGLYAYAPGQGREWRLTAAMNAIIDSMPAGLLRSVSLLVSPTTPVALQPETLASADRRYARRSWWQRGLESAGLLSRGWMGEGDERAIRNVVSVQGPGYQAAQYIGKTLAVERWATSGPSGQGGPIGLSANVAAITMTRSLRHPVFEAGFEGASSFAVETFEPETTRALNGLLTISDLLNPEAPGAVPGLSSDPLARAERLLTQQVHGGLFAMPYSLESAIRVGAVIGLAKRPALVPGFVKSLLG